MLPDPHGGRLIDRELSPENRAHRDAELKDLPKLSAHVDQIYDAEKIAIGAYSPLEGFMGSADLDSVVRTGRLPGGLPWPIPVLFPVTGPDNERVARSARPGDELAILDEAGRFVALLHLEERFHFDRETVARAVYGTDDRAHPNVADLYAAGDEALAGRIDLVRRAERPVGWFELTPAEARAEFGRRGWSRVAAYQCRNPPHTAHEYIQRLTLERDDVDGLFVHPVVGRLKRGDYRPEIILRAYEALVRDYYPAERVLLSALTITMRYGGPKAALFLALVRKNYGCGLYIVGRDQAGIGRYYDPYACHRIFDEFDIGVRALRYDESFHCRVCGGMASARVCPHPASERVDTSQTRIREALAKGSALPPEILRPEVAAILREKDVLIP